MTALAAPPVLSVLGESSYASGTYTYDGTRLKLTIKDADWFLETEVRTTPTGIAFDYLHRYAGMTAFVPIAAMP